MFSFHMLLVFSCQTEGYTKVPLWGGDDDATEGNQAKMLGMMKSYIPGVGMVNLVNIPRNFKKLAKKYGL